MQKLGTVLQRDFEIFILLLRGRHYGIHILQNNSNYHLMDKNIQLNFQTPSVLSVVKRVGC
jgi:hypothetical protein